MSRGLPCLLPLILLTPLPTPAHAHTTPPPAPIALTPDTLGDALLLDPTPRGWLRAAQSDADTAAMLGGDSYALARRATTIVDGQAYAPPR